MQTVVNSMHMLSDSLAESDDTIFLHARVVLPQAVMNHLMNTLPAAPQQQQQQQGGQQQQRKKQKKKQGGGGVADMQQ